MINQLQAKYSFKLQNTEIIYKLTASTYLSDEFLSVCTSMKKDEYYEYDAADEEQEDCSVEEALYKSTK